MSNHIAGDSGSLPEDFPGFDEGRADHQADQADAQNDEAWLLDRAGNPISTPAFVSDELIAALDTAMGLAHGRLSHEGSLQLQSLCLQLKTARARQRLGL